MSNQAAIGKVTAEAAQGGVLIKLVIFSLSLAIVPITSYFASLKYIWSGNATFAAITAVFSANLVLVTYICVSIMEDKKSLGPAVKSNLADSKKER